MLWVTQRIVWSRFLTEGSLQTALFKWATTLEPKYPELKWLHHIPNGGKRDARTASALKNQGVKPGILDISLDVPRHGYHGFRLELKKPGTKAKPSTEQAEYMKFLESQGYFAACESDFEVCKSLILWYLDK